MLAVGAAVVLVLASGPVELALVLALGPVVLALMRPCSL